MTAYFDVFNGDADGLCALHQLRLSEPRDAALVTGVKRDTKLLGHLPAGDGDVVTVMDIGLAQNRAATEALLGKGASILWFDHHFPGEPLQHPGFKAFVDQSPEVCTSILVDRYLGGKYRSWAVAAAFGDGLAGSAEALARDMGLEVSRTEALKQLGVCLNYNAYGDSIEDLHCAPADLYRDLHQYADSWEFMEASPIFSRIASGYLADTALVKEVAPLVSTRQVAVYVLPDAPWARRVSGSFASSLAQDLPHSAVAILTPVSGGRDLRCSIRIPAGSEVDAGAFCRRFPTGGGRATAAGIDALPSDQLGTFIDALRQLYD